MNHRKLSDELMDDPALDPVLHRQALRGLDRLNRLGFSEHILWKTLEPEIARISKKEGRTCRILDVACGSGKTIASMIRRSKGSAKGLGVDISPVAIEAASESFQSKHLTFKTCDVLDPEKDLPSCDVAFCSLFFHHLKEEEVTLLLSKMQRCARSKIIILDLERSLPNRLIIGFASHLVTRSPIVHYDSLRSVEAGWKVSELKDLARKASLGNHKVRRVFPAWLLLES